MGAALHLTNPTEDVPIPTAEKVDAVHHQPPPQQPKRFWRNTLVWTATIVIAFGAGWVLAGKATSHRQKEALPPVTGLSQRDPAAVMVTVEPVARRTVQRTVEGMGTLHGFEEITISARVEGRVRKLHFDVADQVKPEALLLEIDPTDHALSVQQAERTLQAELAKFGLTAPPDAKFDIANVPSVIQARVRMENAKSTFQRLEALLPSGAATKQEHEQAMSDFGAAQAEHANQILLARAGLATIEMKQADLAIARQQLEYTQVFVPVPMLAVPGAEDGVVYAVTDRSVSEGTLVRPGMEICKLAIVRTLKANVPVPERFSTEVRMGQKAEIHTAAFAQPFMGEVTRINPAVDPKTRTFEVEIQVPNPNGDLKPGSFAKAVILTEQNPDATTVPLTALVNFAGINKIFLNENGRAKEVQVTTGVQTTEWIEIKTPALPTDAAVITSGQTMLADDSPVTVRNIKQTSTQANPQETSS